MCVIWKAGTYSSIKSDHKSMLLLLLSRFSCVWFCATPETAAYQALPSLGFSRQEHWSGWPFPSPSASVRAIPFLSIIVPIFAWEIPLVFLIFLKRALVFPILLCYSISLHWSLRKAFLSLLAILWTLHSKGYIFSFLLCLSFSSFPEILLALYISRFVCERSLQHGNTSGKEQKNP